MVTHEHTALPKTVQHPMCICHTLQLGPEAWIKAKCRPIPIVVPPQAGGVQVFCPEALVHLFQLFIAHLGMVVPLGPVNELHSQMVVNFLDICGGGTDVGMSKFNCVSMVSRELGWDRDWDSLPSSEVKHLCSNSDQGPGPLKVATIVVNILD